MNIENKRIFYSYGNKKSRYELLIDLDTSMELEYPSIDYLPKNTYIIFVGGSSNCGYERPIITFAELRSMYLSLMKVLKSKSDVINEIFRLYEIINDANNERFIIDKELKKENIKYDIEQQVYDFFNSEKVLKKTPTKKKFGKF